MPRAPSTATAAALLLTAALGLSGCAGTASGADPSAADLRIGLVYADDGRADEAFRAAAVDGARVAAAGLGGALETVSSAGRADGTAALERLAADGVDPVIAVGFPDAEAVAEVAAAHPATEFAILDVPAAGLDLDNLTGLVFDEGQGGFLTGVAAAAKSVSGHVGFIGGQPAGDLEAGFVAGARAVDPDVVVDTHHLPPRADDARAEEAAREMYRAGADIVLCAVPGSGEGVVDAAVEAGRRAIGVHSDRFVAAAPEEQAVLMTSLVERADLAVEAYVAAVADGSLEPGTDLVQDLATGGVELSDSGGAIDDIEAVLEDYRRKVVDGEIEVPGVR